MISKACHATVTAALLGVALCAPTSAEARVRLRLHRTTHHHSGHSQPAQSSAPDAETDPWAADPAEKKAAGSVAAGARSGSFVGLIGGVMVILGGVGVIGYGLRRDSRG